MRGWGFENLLNVDALANGDKLVSVHQFLVKMTCFLKLIQSSAIAVK